jgi:hypothetical protein
VSPRASPAPAAQQSVDAVESLKRRLLLIAARSDRGQLHNSLVWAEAYGHERSEAAETIASLEACYSRSAVADCSGDWTLVYSSAPLFVSSPFFLAVADAFADREKSELFFKLHELQVASFGISRYGAVTQSLDSATGRLTSRFTTLLFGLTTLPIIGWWKLLPTFGGVVVSTASASLSADGIELELETTRAEQAEGVPLMPFVGRFLVDRETPVGAVWQLLPWNKGRKAKARLTLSYLDGDFRVMRDALGNSFVYTRSDA